MNNTVRLIAGLGLLLIPLAVEAQNAKTPKVSEIRANYQAFQNERVTIEGFVTQWVEDRAKTTGFYLLKDDWGGIIRVRTSKGSPAVGQRYRIDGAVGWDPLVTEPYVAEEVRDELNPPKEAQPSTPVQNSTPQPAAPDNRLLYAAFAIVAIGLGAAWAILRNSRQAASQPTTLDFARAAATAPEAVPPPAEVIEGRTIKIQAPPPGTLKLMNGWLEVLSQDEAVKQIRFYKLKGEPTSETSFGRATGRPYVHVQLKPQTVSSRQAKLAFDAAGAAHLTNFVDAGSNPTRINQRDMQVGETVALQEGDEVDMGEVKFRFHAN